MEEKTNNDHEQTPSNNINIEGTGNDQSQNKMEISPQSSENINDVSNAYENKSLHKNEIIESKENEVEKNTNTNSESLEQKYDKLKEQVENLVKIIQEERNNK